MGSIYEMPKKKDEDGPLGHVLRFLFIVPIVLLQGAVCSSIWSWWVVPFGLPPISTTQAAGILSLITAARGHSMATLKAVQELSDKPWDVIGQIATVAGYYGLVLLIAWVLHVL